MKYDTKMIALFAVICLISGVLSLVAAQLLSEHNYHKRADRECNAACEITNETMVMRTAELGCICSEGTQYRMSP